MEDFLLLISRQLPNSSKDIERGVGWWLDIGSTLVTGRAENPEIVAVIRSPLTDGFHMVDVQSDLAVRIERVGIARSGTAQLACEPVALEDLVSELRRYSTRDDRIPVKRFEDVFAGFEVCTINMRLDLVSLFVTQFTDAASVLTDAADLAKFLRRYNLTDIRNQKFSNPVSGSHSHLSMNRASRRSSRSASFV